MAEEETLEVAAETAATTTIPAPMATRYRHISKQVACFEVAVVGWVE